MFYVMHLTVKERRYVPMQEKQLKCSSVCSGVVANMKFIFLCERETLRVSEKWRAIFLKRIRAFSSSIGDVSFDSLEKTLICCWIYG